MEIFPYSSFGFEVSGVYVAEFGSMDMDIVVSNAMKVKAYMKFLTSFHLDCSLAILFSLK